MSNPIAVPLCDIRPHDPQLESGIHHAVLRVLASGQVILGPEVEALEDEVARYSGAGFGVGCASGTDALLLALQALEIGRGDEVIVPPFTFFATVGAVCRTGATPVFVDIDPETYNMNPDEVEMKITSRTKAVMPVHLFGQTADMEPIWQIAEKHRLPIIEDAAQALGAEYQGKRTGTLGALACFSFYPSKNLGACGDAGMVLTSDPEWAQRMKALRVHGTTEKYCHQYIGGNFRIDAIQAAILRVKLPHLEQWIEFRQAAAERYDMLIEEYDLTSLLQRPAVADQRRHVYSQYVVRVTEERRNALVKHLKADNIGCDIYYPVPVHLQECLSDLNHTRGDFPAAEDACRSVLALPMFPSLSADQQHRVMESCSTFLHGKRAAAA